MLDVETLGERYPVVPGAPRVARHPLLEAALDALAPPENVSIDVTVRSSVPAGCGTGTSAAVAVALLGGLAAIRSQSLSPQQAAYEAHRLEVGVLGLESGIQDQLSAALGGINYLEIDRYPEAIVHALPAWDELGPCLTLVFLGHTHSSSAVHRQVIEDVVDRGSGSLARLREAAEVARDAFVRHDLSGFGHTMIANTDAQSSLHADLVGVDAQRVIRLAAAHGAIGWKVNGAGGDGGSVTILNASPSAKEVFEPRVTELDASYRVLPVHPSPSGLQVRALH